ncbi:MAG: hypothetical protein HeimAB125_23510, partial [Candidatus Heimdallarchaeota archaeon AB_125]
MKKSFIITFILLCCFILPIPLNVDAKPSVPVLEWSIQLKGSDTNLVDFDSEGNLLVFHDGDYSLHELLTFFTPD